MTERKLELRFEEISRTDIPELTAVMTRAFDDDAQKHLGIEKGGPEGYDNGDFFRTWLFGYDESVGYKVLTGEAIVGGIIVWLLDRGDNRVGTIFVDPAYQDRGVGTRTWRFIEETFPDSRSWTLGTPVWATKNHHFYERKCGFRPVETKEDSITYRKVMGADS